MACFSAPSTTQPGPAITTAAHQPRLFSGVLGGMKRR